MKWRLVTPFTDEGGPFCAGKDAAISTAPPAKDSTTWLVADLAATEKQRAKNKKRPLSPPQPAAVPPSALDLGAAPEPAAAYAAAARCPPVAEAAADDGDEKAVVVEEEEDGGGDGPSRQWRTLRSRFTS